MTILDSKFRFFFVPLFFVAAPAFVSAATLSVSPSSGSFAVGNIITVNIQVNTQGSASDGVDVRYLNFNPAQLQVIDKNLSIAGVQITAGSLMPNTPANSVDNTAGRIMFSQVPTAGGTAFTNSVSQTLATVSFNVVGSGTASVTFNHTPGSTADSNVASGGSDLLTSVTNGSYTLSGANNPPTVSAISTNVPDVAPGTAGIQYYEGTTVTYSGTASDPDGNPLTWTWLYTINGGPEISFLSGSGAVQNAVFTYGAGTAGSTYRWILRASDGQATSESTLDIMIITVPDTTNPVISAIASSNITTAGATITWITNEPADSQVEYGITTSYGQSSPLNTSLVTAHSVFLTSLSANSLYHYRVKSRDAAGNLGQSLDRTFTTQALPDTTPPTAIVGASVSSMTTISATFSWVAPADLPGGGAVASYDIRYATALITELNFGSLPAVAGEPAPATPGTLQTYIIAGLNPSTLYYAAIKSQDAAGNVSLISNVASFTTQAPLDTTAPSIPTGLSATAISISQINLIWNASTDNVGVTGYRVYRCQGSGCIPSTIFEIALSATTSYSDTGLTPNTAYRYRIRAVDAAGNTSALSVIVDVTTQDTIAPSVSIIAPLSNDIVAGTISVIANATDNVGVIGVQFLIDGANLGAEKAIAPYNVSWTTTSVLDGSHILTARARDAAGNTTTSGGITIQVLNNPPPPFDFSLSNEGNKGVAKNSSVTNTITATLVSGTTKAVAFSLSGLPAGATGSLLPLGCNPGCSTILTINAIETAQVGSYPITVSGTGDGKTRTTQFTLSITPPPSSKFKKNDRIAVKGTEVRSSGSLSSTLLGIQPVGTLGTVIGGPVFSDALFWWQIDYDTTGGIGSDIDGWTREDHLELAVFVTGTKFVPYVEGNIIATRSFTVNILQSNASTTLFTFTVIPDPQQQIPVAISTLLEGTYDLLIHSPSFLRKKMDNVVISSNTAITLPTLLGGDFNNDDIINEIDWSYMNPRWFSIDLNADLNRDGIVNTIDFSYMNKNWNMVGI